MMFTLASLFLTGITVVLPGEARVRGAELALGQLATIEGDDAELAARVSALAVGHAPAPGYTRTLQRWQLEERVRTDFPGASIAFRGSGACRVILEVERVAGQAIQSAARTELAGVFGQREISIATETAVADVDVPLGAAPARLRASIDRRELRGGAWQVPVQILVDGAPYQTVWAAFQVELFDLVPVLVRDVRRGELLGSDLIETRRVRISAQEAGAFLAPEKLVGASAVRDLAAGRGVVEADVKRALLVRQGDTVELSVRKGPILARATATALQGGAIGDKVRVSTGDKNRSITGVIVGRNQIEVDLSRAGQSSGGTQ